MARGPKKGSKRYVCREEGCERYGKIQYIQPWDHNIRCKGCGSENLEEVTPTVKPLPKPPGLAQAESAEPTGAESEAGPTPEPEPEDAEPPVESTPEPPKVTPKPKAPKPEPRATLVQPKDGDKVRCKKCNWAVFWDSKYHKKITCHAAGCGSTDLEIVMPVEGK